MFIENEFNLRQVVYLKTDKDQLPRIITAIKIVPEGLMYELSQGPNNSWHYDFEITETVDVMLTSTN